jgi:hypothetical protein
MKPVNQRIGKVAQILAIPLVAFTLGRMSVERFSGSGWAWASVVLGAFALAVLLSAAVYVVWTSED